MGYKNILVHLDDDPRQAERIELAFGLAERFAAHLVGLHAPAVENLIPAVPGAPVPMAAIASVEQHRQEREAAARRRFDAAARRHPDIVGEWRGSAGLEVEETCLSARFADLIIVGQYEPEGAPGGMSPSFAEDLVLESGRPVLIIPYAGKFGEVGKRVMVAWDGSREAARAVSDALPLLRKAENVSVAIFGADKFNLRHGEQPGADIAAFLARHGINVEVAQQQSESEGIGEQMLSRTMDFLADLVVMGGYGHSRFRESIFGGVTKTILKSMTVPVLMSH